MVRFGKDMEFRLGQMALNIKAIGKITRQVGKVSLRMQMAIFMMANGKKIKHQDLAFIYIITALSIKDNGCKTISMAMAFKFGQMEVSMKEFISKEKKTVKENILGKMVAIIMEIGMIIR